MQRWKTVCVGPLIYRMRSSSRDALPNLTNESCLKIQK
ncbi:hypothetical protein T10_9600 [Trichinella papuae]|uniref:Uncharacterized protein n=1 Tax=Trichinella papuae TaxID=268474 RepID=A0A0V1LX18_9BILA|nr:hypothetical protein T10_9600 [Trichinella papuae]